MPRGILYLSLFILLLTVNLKAGFYLQLTQKDLHDSDSKTFCKCPTIILKVWSEGMKYQTSAIEVSSGQRFNGIFGFLFCHIIHKCKAPVAPNFSWQCNTLYLRTKKNMNFCQQTVPVLEKNQITRKMKNQKSSKGCI